MQVPPGERSSPKNSAASFRDIKPSFVINPQARSWEPADSLPSELRQPAHIICGCGMEMLPLTAIRFPTPVRKGLGAGMRSATSRSTYNVLADNVSQAEAWPELKPLRNHRLRCSDVPWVKESGTT